MTGKAKFWLALFVTGVIVLTADLLGMFSGRNLNIPIESLWSMWEVKVALASIVVLFIIVLLVVRKRKNSAPRTSSSPKAVTIGFSGYIIQFAMALLFATAAVWAAWHWGVLGISNTLGPQNPWVRDQPRTVVVNNGFHRHDAKFPKIITPKPLKKKLQPDRVYDAFKVEKGDYFQISFSRPIKLRIKGTGSTGFAKYKTPGRFRAKNGGVIQVQSETGGNIVKVEPST